MNGQYNNYGPMPPGGQQPGGYYHGPQGNHPYGQQPQGYPYPYGGMPPKKKKNYYVGIAALALTAATFGLAFSDVSGDITLWVWLSALALSFVAVFFRPRVLGCIGLVVNVGVFVVFIVGILFAVGQYRPPVHNEEDEDTVAVEQVEQPGEASGIDKSTVVIECPNPSGEDTSN